MVCVTTIQFCLSNIKAPILCFLVTQSCLTLQPHGLQTARFLCPWNSPSKNTRVGCHALLRGSSQPGNRAYVSHVTGGFFTIWATREAQKRPLLLLLSRFSRVRLCAAPQTAAHQAPPSLGFPRQEHWSRLPFPSPMHESEKWKWSRSVVSDSSRPHGLQPTRLLCPWDFPGKSTGVGCHCLLRKATTDIHKWVGGAIFQ